jgi:pimeloyl-ACP methyl ester carboxylesterase
VSDGFSAAEPDLVVLYNLISSFGSKPTSIAMLAHMAEAEYSDAELAALELPVAFVIAELDEFCPPEVMTAASRRFPTATVEVIPGASHSAYYELPAAWNERVLALTESGVRV